MTFEEIGERQRHLANLREPFKTILSLADAAVNNMGFACQGAEQQNERMQIRYEERASENMRILRDMLIAESERA